MYKNHVKVSKISQNQIFVPVILFWVKKVVKKVLRESEFGLSLFPIKSVLWVSTLGFKKEGKNIYDCGYHRKM